MPRSDNARALSTERLAYEFEELELSPYEARILLALLRLGSANTAQLARVAEVPRTSVYTNLEELERVGLAQRLPVDGPAVYASPGREEVFARLDALQEERLKAHRERTARLREMVSKAFPEEPPSAGPYVQVLQGANQIRHMYDRLLGQARRELLVFNRPPYSLQGDWVNPAVLEAIQRGARARVLYEAKQWHDRSSASFRAAMAVYHEAGVEGRLVKELPLKLAIVDKKSALLTMADPLQPDIGFPTTLLVEHPGFAAMQSDAFDLYFASAEPVVDDAPPDGGATSTAARRSPAKRSAKRTGRRSDSGA